MNKNDLIAALKKHPLPIACFALSLGIGGFIFTRLDDIPELETEIQQKSEQAEKYSANIKYSTQLKEQLESVTAANKAIEARLVRATQQGNNTQYFYKLERDTGVKLMSFSQAPTPPAPKGAKTAFASVPFSVTVQGTLPQVLNFLRQVESGTHYARVLSSGISVNSGTRSGPITLTLYVELLGLP